MSLRIILLRFRQRVRPWAPFPMLESCPWDSDSPHSPHIISLTIRLLAKASGGATGKTWVRIGSDMMGLARIKIVVGALSHDPKDVTKGKSPVPAKPRAFTR